ncbi:hypothetical protein niasHT_036843 [Heterodera trifolii]|uniref:Uncharacterized protein n=1 Tax=Heterodera trifolii TaxID=157864 RepID=A0ABD2I8R1_9BILA
MENYEVPPRESFDGDEEYEEARRLGVARVRADEEKARIKMPNEHSNLFKADEFGSTRKFSKQKNRRTEDSGPAPYDNGREKGTCCRSRRLPTDRCVRWRRPDWRATTGNSGRGILSVAERGR